MKRHEKPLILALSYPGILHPPAPHAPISHFRPILLQERCCIPRGLLPGGPSSAPKLPLASTLLCLELFQLLRPDYIPQHALEIMSGFLPEVFKVKASTGRQGSLAHRCLFLALASLAGLRICAWFPKPMFARERHHTSLPLPPECA